MKTINQVNIIILGMKVNRLMIELLKLKITKDNAKIVKKFHLDPKFKIKENVPYIDDGNYYHQYDVLYGVGKKKNVCIIDIHGGSYIFGNRKENHHFATYFLERGFDFITTDYIPNKGKRGTFDIVLECVKCIEHISTHLKELNLDKDVFVITGDSAGGHLALITSEIVLDKDFAKNFTQNTINLDLRAVLVNCTTFNYVNLGRKEMTKGAQRRMFGPKYNDLIQRNLISPLTHLDSLTVPLFASTCRYDFIRGESLKLNEIASGQNREFLFLDIDSKDKRVGHVHNILDIELKESKMVNDAMIDFIDKYINN